MVADDLAALLGDEAVHALEDVDSLVTKHRAQARQHQREHFKVVGIIVDQDQPTELLDAGLGTISEIFDGEPPHEPRGAPSQAWSVAGVLEAWVKLERVRRTATQKEED